MAARCTHGHVLKLTSMYFAMAPSLDTVERSHDGTPEELV
jgi:hypothetical protein